MPREPRLRTSAVAAMMLLVAAVGAWPSPAAAGNPLGSEFQVNTETGGDQYTPAVAPDGGGAFVVVWASATGTGTDASGSSIQAQRFDAAGVPVGGELQVNTYTTANQRNPVAAPSGDGGFVVVWRSDGSAATDADGTSLQAQRFDATGAPTGAEFQVNAYTPADQRFPAVAPDGAGGFVVAWESGGGSPTDASGSSLQARRFAADGTPAGDEMQVNTYTTGDQFAAAVAPDGAGGFVVLWTSQGSAGTDIDETSIQGQRFDGAGAPAGAEFQVNSWTTGIQSGPAVGPDGAGGFVVAWASDGSYGTDSSGASIQGQRFASDGTPAGSQFQINSYTTDDQLRPSVAADGAGGFVVVWMSYGSVGTDQSSASVQGQRFEATGMPVGEQFQVNTYTSLSQRSERDRGVSPDGAGGFVVVWRSDGSNGSDTDGASVQAQRFGTSGGTTTTTTPGGSTTTTTLPAGADPVAGTKLLIKRNERRPQKSKLVVLSKDRGLTIGRGNGSADDPVLHGGQLTITSGGVLAAVYDLLGSWKHRGKVGRDKGYKWKAKGAPIRTIVVKNGKLLKIVGKGDALGLDLSDDPSPVRVELRIGGHVYCAVFVGDSASFEPGARFRAKRAPAPASCS